ncbi:hydroxyacylglutathione hydrolase [Ampullimonas aquatilis]|uniref:hydroxyacylglutathione hydrolase n=1 Tax=Ampullimonas aquatilis TaxID=1341549 RepID=UPI003C70B149
MSITVTPISAFNDNYIWLLSDGKYAVVVDPGQAAPVISALEEQGLTLTDILITHHHPDHVGGIPALKYFASESLKRIIGPAAEIIEELTEKVNEGDTVSVLGNDFKVMDVGGHTKGHIAFYHAANEALGDTVFCGDTLFSCGCGRLFEGTPEQMLASLDKLTALPDDTLVYCAHEYTLPNIRFARAVDLANTELALYERHCLALREEEKPTIPSSIGLEKKVNPFLRCDEPALRKMATTIKGQAITSRLDAFAALREWKDIFR